MSRFLALACLAFFSTALTAGENWPGWRGPTGMGVTDEKDLPLSWGGAKQENVLWKVPLFPSDKARRDQNQSSPIVWGKNVFVTVSYWPEGKSEKEYPEHHLLCFDAASGDRRWDTLIAPGPWKLTDLRGGYTAPTPACDADHVYALFGSSVLAAVDHAGKIAWSKEIAPFHFDVAFGASPILSGEHVIVTCDQLRDRKSSRLVAFDKKTGNIAWEKKRAVDWAHSTPVLAPVGGKTQLLVATANGPQGLDPATGDVLWQVQTKDRTGDTVSPVAAGKFLYVDSGRGGPGIVVDPTGTGDVSATHLRWQIAHVPEGFSSPVIVGEQLYRLHSPGVLTSWKLDGGKEVFKERLMGIDVAVSPFVTPEGRIYCVSSGKSYVVQADTKLEILGQGDLGDPGRSSPAVAGGRIYVKGSRFLFCIGKKQ